MRKKKLAGSDKNSIMLEASNLMGSHQSDAPWKPHKRGIKELEAPFPTNIVNRI